MTTHVNLMPEESAIDSNISSLLVKVDVYYEFKRLLELCC